MASTAVMTATDDNFEQTVLQSNVPVLVDFWASWCAPCLAIGPHIDALAQDFQGALRVAKLNVDENQQVARTYGVRSIPTLLIFHKGKVIGDWLGNASKAKLEQFVRDTLAKVA